MTIVAQALTEKDDALDAGQEQRIRHFRIETSGPVASF
jgi:hypothetical protein